MERYEGEAVGRPRWSSGEATGQLPPALAAIEPVYRYRATAHRVVDGDTFVADVDLGFAASIRIRVRLHGVNTPERGKPGYKEASAYLEHLTGAATAAPSPLILQSYKDARSFERWVCDVWIADGVLSGRSLVEGIIEAGHGVPFMA